jgi:integrase
MNELRHRAEDYLATRRALGYKLHHHGRLLSSFVEFCEAADADYVSVDLAIHWATLPQEVQPIWWSQRLGVIRGFARHLATVDDRTEIPPTDALAARAPRTPPHLFSATEIAELMAEARRIRFPLKAATYETLIGLLASSGLRVGEAIRLDDGDVDLASGLITIRQTKFRKSRLIPLHPSTCEALAVYARLRRELLDGRPIGSFFVSLVGTPLLHGAVNQTFRTLVQATGLEQPGRRRPRPHDLRHSFTISVLLDWYRSGVDVAPRLAALSTYLGHHKPSSTYWYLQASPELFALAAERLETRR